MCKQPMIGLAGLIRCAQFAQTEEQLEEMAKILGYVNKGNFNIQDQSDERKES